MLCLPPSEHQFAKAILASTLMNLTIPLGIDIPHAILTSLLVSLTIPWGVSMYIVRHDLLVLASTLVKLIIPLGIGRCI